MRSFSCPVCGHLVFFENFTCLHCGSELGWYRTGAAMVVPGFRCANAGRARCNGVVDVDGELCGCCALTRTRPADGSAAAEFADTEAARRRLVYQLDDLGLSTDGVVFDLLSSEEEPVITGHADGVVTIDLAEDEDAHREALRVQLAEPYRTMRGHPRHETGHWYWTVPVERDPRPFRELFGDERADDGEALKKHYAQPAPDGWEDSFVSAYATAHPWEDWAESFAQYLPIRDTLQTAAAFGTIVRGPGAESIVPLGALPRENPAGFDEIVDTWLTLTYALNAVNRSMGKDDLYPFVLSPPVLRKLGFVHDAVTAGSRTRRTALSSHRL